MRRRLPLLALLLILAVTPALSANDQQFLLLFGGYSLNDDDSLLENSTPYGLRWGGESPAAGGQISVELNRDGEYRMDTLLFSVMWNFYSHDSRTAKGRILFNRFSAFTTTGIGAMRYENKLKEDTDVYLAYEVGVGVQYKFASAVGLRWQVNAISASTFKFLNFESTLGIAFYW